MQLRSAAVPGRSEVETLKTPETPFGVQAREHPFFLKSAAVRRSNVAAPGDGRTPCASCTGPEIGLHQTVRFSDWRVTMVK
jgi:hypothetical protein